MKTPWQQVFTEWLSRSNRTLAVVRPGIDDLAARLGVAWQRASDNLDDFDYAVIESRTGRVFALRRYLGMPTPGTEVVVGLGLEKPECALEEALASIGLASSDVTWTAPQEVSGNSPQGTGLSG